MMVRPRKRRMVNFEHNIRHFKPTGICLNELDEINITFDELESLRLSYIENLKQGDAADNMHVHQSTYQRTLQKTLQKIADALVYGKSIRVEGGDFTMPGKGGTGPMGKGSGGRHNRRGGQKNGRFSESMEAESTGLMGKGLGGRHNRGRGQKRGRFSEDTEAESTTGSGQYCKCPDCGYEQPHTPGVPCGQNKCPKCGKTMVRN
jgi:hypothetical protein